MGNKISEHVSYCPVCGYNNIASSKWFSANDYTIIKHCKDCDIDFEVYIEDNELKKITSED